MIPILQVCMKSLQPGCKHISQYGVFYKGNSNFSLFKDLLGAPYGFQLLFSSPLCINIFIHHCRKKEKALNPKQVKLPFSLKGCCPRGHLPELWFSIASLEGTECSVIWQRLQLLQNKLDQHNALFFFTAVIAHKAGEEGCWRGSLFHT